MLEKLENSCQSPALGLSEIIGSKGTLFFFAEEKAHITEDCYFMAHCLLPACHCLTRPELKIRTLPQVEGIFFSFFSVLLIIFTLGCLVVSYLNLKWFWIKV